MSIIHPRYHVEVAVRPSSTPRCLTRIHIVLKGKWNITRYYSVGSGADPGLQLSARRRLQSFINPAVDYQYFPLDPRSPSQLKSVDHYPLASSKLYCLVTDTLHMCVNNLPSVVTRRWNGRDSNPRPHDRDSNALTITPPYITIVI